MNEIIFRSLRTHFILLVLISCTNAPSPAHFSSNWQLISGRDEGHLLDRPLIYRALVPSDWTRRDPLSHESISDTKKAICEFYKIEDNQTIRLTIHTFPIIEAHLRIPPQAQIARWKRQFDTLDPLHTLLMTETSGGFSGLYFEGQGILQGQPTKVMGWSMQLASGYERRLSLEKHPLDRLKRADYTIKASGPIDLMNKYHAAIVAFAHSFELIDELPSLL